MEDEKINVVVAPEGTGMTASTVTLAESMNKQIEKLPKFNQSRPKRRILTDEEVMNIIDLQTSTMYKALVALLYLYGCRISEAIALKRKDFENDATDFLWVTMPTLKKKKTSKPVIHERKLNVSRESPFVDYIVSHLKNLNSEDFVFPISRQQAYYNICLPFGRSNEEQKERAFKEINVWLHYFRDSCLTQLVWNGATPFQLKQWAGWSGYSAATHYIEESQRITTELGMLRVKRGWTK
jgi:integrase